MPGSAPMPSCRPTAANIAHCCLPGLIRRDRSAVCPPNRVQAYTGTAIATVLRMTQLLHPVRTRTIGDRATRPGPRVMRTR